MRTFEKLKLPAALLMLFLMTGCGTATSGIDSGCKSFSHIKASKDDTALTKRQIIGHNRAWDAICS